MVLFWWSAVGGLCCRFSICGVHSLEMPFICVWVINPIVCGMQLCGGGMAVWYCVTKTVVIGV